MSRETIGLCRYCGQANVVMTSGDAEDAVIERAATVACSCAGAARERNAEQGRERLESIIGEKASEAGFQPVDAALFELIMSAFVLVADGMLHACSFDLGNSRLRITSTDHKGIVIDRKRTVSISG